MVTCWEMSFIRYSQLPWCHTAAIVMILQIYTFDGREYLCTSICSTMYEPLTFSHNEGMITSSKWRHQMEIFSALLAICAGNSPVPGEFPIQRQVTRNFDVFLDLCPNKRLDKQGCCEAVDLRRHRAHYDDTVMEFRFFIIVWNIIIFLLWKIKSKENIYLWLIQDEWRT